MTCDVSDEQLWSWIDRNAEELEAHLAICPECRARAEAIRSGIQTVATGSTVLTIRLPARIGSYDIKRLLGEGGQGVVYEAEQQSRQRSVALKVLKGGRFVGTHDVRRFRREIQTLATLKHGAIATFYEAGLTEEGQHFFAMELVEGRPLNAHVHDNEVPLEGRLELFRKVCDAVHYAHRHGVIHRDLKPSNIFIDSEGSPKILDFGLARMANTDVTLTTVTTERGQPVGTLRYMSPEQARGETTRIVEQSDVYALGVILYELLTDQPPYDVDKPMPEAVATICQTPPAKPSSMRRALRGDLETIVLKALEKETARRYQSVEELGDDVRRYLNEEPILANRPGRLGALRRRLFKHRLPIAVGATAITLVVTSLIGGSWWSQRSLVKQQRAEDLARARRDVLMAFTMLEDGRTENAYSLASRYCSEYPGLPETVLLRARVCLQIGLESESEQRTKSLREARVKLEAAAPNGSWQSAYDLLLGDVYEALGRPAKAAEVRRGAEREAIDTAEAWYLRSLATPDAMKAVDCVARALDLDPEYTPAWVRRAYLRLQAGDQDGALASFRKLASLTPEVVQWGVEEARILLQQGAYEEVIARCSELARLTPEDQPPHQRKTLYYYRALVHLCAMDYREAVEDYATVLKLAPTDAWSPYYQATPLWILNRTSEAEQDYREFLARYPTHHCADARLILILYAQGRDPEAQERIAAIRTSVEAEKWEGKILACLARDIRPCDLVAAAQSEKPRSLAHVCESYYYAAETCLLLDDTSQAREWFDKCVRMNLPLEPGASSIVPMSEYHLARWRLAQLDRGDLVASRSAHDPNENRQGDHTASIQRPDAERAEARRDALSIRTELARDQADGVLGRAEILFEHRPESPEARLVFAQARYLVYCKTGNVALLESAFNVLEDGCHTGPAPWACRALLEELYEASGNSKLAQLRGLEEMAPPNTAEAWLLRSLTTLDLQKAAAYAEKALERNPDYVLALEHLASLSELNGDFHTALRAAEIMIQRGDDSSPWIRFKGHMLMKLKQYAEAVTPYTRSVEFDRDSYWPYRLRGMAHLCHEDYLMALADYNKANELDPASPWVRFQRATVLWILGRWEEAAEDYRAVIEARGLVSYAEIRLILILREQDRHDEADNILAAARQRIDDGSWLAAILDCVAGSIAPKELVARAGADPTQPERRCEAYYYAGEACLLQGDREHAREWFLCCVRTDLALDPHSSPPDPMNEYHLAKWRLNQLTGQRHEEGQTDAVEMDRPVSYGGENGTTRSLARDGEHGTHE